MERVLGMMDIMKKVTLGYICNLILYALFAALLAFTSLPETTIPVVTTMIGIIGVLLASFMSLKKIKKNGLRNGALVGGIYVFLLYIISSLIEHHFGLTDRALTTIIIYVIFGMVGGILGVNVVSNN